VGKMATISLINLLEGEGKAHTCAIA
jgi:hypothetical protein